MKKRKQISLVKIVIIIAFIICCLSVIGYYFIYQDSEVIAGVKASQAALNTGNLTTAIKDLDNVGVRTFADRQLVETQEEAIKSFETISTQYNTASNYLNNSQYAECLQILDSLHTSNGYLNSKIQNALTICNESFPQLLYKEGVSALKDGNKDSANNYYKQLANRYPSSPFTKQLGNYLNGDADDTVKSFNILISRPGIGSIGSDSTTSEPATPSTTNTPSAPVKATSTSNTQPKSTPTNNNNNTNSTSATNTTATATANANDNNQSLNNAPVTVAHFTTTQSNHPPDSAPAKQTVSHQAVQAHKTESASTVSSASDSSDAHTTADKTTDTKSNK